MKERIEERRKSRGGERECRCRERRGGEYDMAMEVARHRATGVVFDQPSPETSAKPRPRPGKADGRRNVSRTPPNKSARPRPAPLSPVQRGGFLEGSVSLVRHNTDTMCLYPRFCPPVAYRLIHNGPTLKQQWFN